MKRTGLQLLAFSNEIVLFTGTLTGYTRSEAQQLVLTAGGRVLNYCSSTVTLLVVGVIDKGLFEPPTTHKLTYQRLLKPLTVDLNVAPWNSHAHNRF
ncbi:hypothetical protein CUJ85_10165 [Limosilactobacillus fermentum]|nr:hypothetical protein CUJ85_10165 [Limosilactobacillus fermentum]